MGDGNVNAASFAGAALIGADVFGRSSTDDHHMITHGATGGLGIAGAQIGFGDHSTLRGQAGLRAGSALFDNADYRFDASATAGYWYRISGSSGATINSGPSAPLLSVSDTQVNGYGDIGLGLNLLGKTSGWSGFIKGSYQYASGFNAGTVKGGVRYSF